MELKTRIMISSLSITQRHELYHSKMDNSTAGMWLSSVLIAVLQTDFQAFGSHLGP